jgi:hypothetical protein
MYCVKVEPGKERIKVRQVASGFLPSYREADETGRPDERKRFVVPGYVFMLQYAPGAVKVPEDEWAIIEAVSDSHLSTVDRETRKIAEGPLKAIEGAVTVIEADRAKVAAVILGEKRQYWLAVKYREPEGETSEEAAAENGNHGTDAEGRETEAGNAEDIEASEKAVSAGKSGTEGKTGGKPRSKYDFTEEEKARMLARAEEVGNRQAAAEFTVPWQMIAQMKRREREKNAGPEAAATRKYGQRKKEDPDALKAENTALREKLAQLEGKAAKLRKAIQELL